MAPSSAATPSSTPRLRRAIYAGPSPLPRAPERGGASADSSFYTRFHSPEPAACPAPIFGPPPKNEPTSLPLRKKAMATPTTERVSAQSVEPWSSSLGGTSKAPPPKLFCASRIRVPSQATDGSPRRSWQRSIGSCRRDCLCREGEQAPRELDVLIRCFHELLEETSVLKTN